jgi:TRAP-type uncharacterized transport system fused permease subunit
LRHTDLVNSDAGVVDLTFSIIQTLTIIMAIAVAIEGYLLRPLTGVERLLAFLTIPLVMLDPFGAGFLGIVIMIGLILVQWKGRGRSSQS